MTKTKRRRLLQKIYARIPELHCRGLCTSQCSVIPMHDLEIEAMRKARGQPIETYARADGMHMTLLSRSGGCPLLERGRCTVYEVRPLICRMFGAVDGMRCPHGCRPQRTLSEKESRNLMKQLQKL